MNTPDRPAESTELPVSGHGGAHVVAAAKAHEQDVLWTLSGAHVFPVYDAAVGGREAVDQAGSSQEAQSSGPMRILDVRNEATAVFAAEATGKLTRKPGFAVVTAGPGVTNAVSGITSAFFNGSPLVVLGGRAPAARWGTGALQELDHPPILESVTKSAFTVPETAGAATAVDSAFALAARPHRGPVFLDMPMDALFSYGDSAPPAGTTATVEPVDTEAVDRITAAVAQAKRPVFVFGGDVWSNGAEDAAKALADTLSVPVILNGMGRGILPPGNPNLVTRARSAAFNGADLVVVVGAPLDFRLGYGSFGGKEGASPAEVIEIADAPGQIAEHVSHKVAVAGDLTTILTQITNGYGNVSGHDHTPWSTELLDKAKVAMAQDESVLHSDSDPINPGRIYGELRPRLESDAVVIGDGGDFVSYAGKYIEPQQPGNWLDPGPYGCLGTGLGYAMSARVHRPESQVVLLLGDGAAGFSLMDVDSLVRQDLPIVMIVGNNAAWGLEKHPMQFLYGYDVAADLAPTRYDEVVQALGGAGETVSQPGEIGPAMDRAFAAGVPYLVNVLTDPAVAYPRATTGV
ncbi:MAG: acetolactate synthase [Actinomycetia bacterium]|nr:acetolactate synthase [Actinomycetes bacterium]